MIILSLLFLPALAVAFGNDAIGLERRLQSICDSKAEAVMTCEAEHIQACTGDDEFYGFCFSNSCKYP